MTRIGIIWDWIERTVVGLLGAFALVIAVLQVFGRYIDPAHAITWAEEVIVYIAVWAVMLVASDLVRTNGHVRPDLVLRLLRPQAQRWVETFNCLVAIAFTFGLVWRTAGRWSIPRCCSIRPAPRICGSRCGSTIWRCRLAVV